MSSKYDNTPDLPTPVYQGPGHYFCPSFDKYRRAKGQGYDVYLEEHGWRCSNRWCDNPWGCPHALRIPDYLFEEAIIATIPEAKPLSPARSFMAQGGSLETLFDYGNPTPPTHAVTNRKRVAAAR